ncbi:MAG: M20 family metallopeptidase [Deltaproteobacteria bacterium]
MINRIRLINLTRKLIQIDSQNPCGNESKIAAFVGGRMRALGLKTAIFEFKKKRSNVIAALGSGSRRPSLLITPHLDTVPAGSNWRIPPFSGRIRGDKLYGLGATDCKGNLAVAMEVINSLAEEKVSLGYNLIFAATADEESGSDLGLIPLLKKGILNPEAALVLDADEFNIVITQKGLIHLKVKIQGKRAHGAYPWRGINAIDLAVNILKELKMHEFPGSYRNPHLGPPTMNIGTIRGGDKVNVVADWCEFELDFRFLPGQRSGEVLKHLRSVISRYTRKFKIEIEGIQAPYWIDSSHPLINYLTRAMRRFKIKPRIKGSEGATVITFFQNKNIPAVATGFGSEKCAHAANEYVKTGNLYKGALVLEEFLKSYSFNNNRRY